MSSNFISDQVFRRLLKTAPIATRHKCPLKFIASLDMTVAYLSISYWNWYRHKPTASGECFNTQIPTNLYFAERKFWCLSVKIHRFNLTNSEEPYFLVESLEALHSIDSTEDRSFHVVIYSVNQKGRSPKVVLKDLLIGDRDHHSASKWPLFIIYDNNNRENIIGYISSVPLSKYIYLDQFE